MNADALALLIQIRDELRAIREAVEGGRGAQPQGRHADLGQHLHAIAAVVGSRIFSVNELLAHAAIPEGEALRSAIIGMAGSLNGKRLGKLLRTIEGQSIAGLLIERVGEDRLGAAWVLRECEFQTRKPTLAIA